MFIIQVFFSQEYKVVHSSLSVIHYTTPFSSEHFPQPVFQVFSPLPLPASGTGILPLTLLPLPLFLSSLVLSFVSPSLSQYTFFKFLDTALQFSLLLLKPYQESSLSSDPRVSSEHHYVLPKNRSKWNKVISGCSPLSILTLKKILKISTFPHLFSQYGSDKEQSIKHILQVYRSFIHIAQYLYSLVLNSVH